MNLEDYRVVFAVSGLILILVASAPTLSLVLPFSGGECFSELWILGPNHMAEDYPFNVVNDTVYNVFLGIGNHMGSSAYYMVYVKFRNQSEPLPNATAGTHSPLNATAEYRIFLQGGESWEAPLTFSFLGNQSLIQSLIVNNVEFAVNKTALWDGENNGYYYQLFLELWIYDAESDAFQYHNRFVGIWLNMTGV